MMRLRNLLASALFALSSGSATAMPDAGALFQEHCAQCHGSDRLGAIGPALLPDNLGRLGKAGAEVVVRDGRAATQMQGFAAKLSEEEIKALAAFVYSQPEKLPVWGDQEIAASRVLGASSEIGKHIYSADPLNLFVVVESGDHHVTILDGDRFEPIARFESRFALHGGPKFTSDGRYVFSDLATDG